MMNTHTVIVVLEAKAGKEADLKNALDHIVKQSRLEKGCLEFRLHQDNNNAAQFILYENWGSVEAHEEHFKESYVQEFAKNADDLLAKPYEAYFAKEFQF